MLHLYSILLTTILEDIIPLTKNSILKGNKIFGGAILNKNDYSLICIGTNNEVENPINHGEISTLNNFFKISSNNRPESISLSKISKGIIIEGVLIGVLM